MVTTNNLTTVEIKSDQELIEKQPGILPVLKTLLADETMLYISMIGMNLDPLDVMFEDHLDKVDDVMDKITGLMRQYSKKMSGRVDERAQKSHLKKVPHVSASGRSQIARLIIGPFSSCSSSDGRQSPRP